MVLNMCLKCLRWLKENYVYYWTKKFCCYKIENHMDYKKLTKNKYSASLIRTPVNPNRQQPVYHINSKDPHNVGFYI